MDLLVEKGFDEHTLLETCLKNNGINVDTAINHLESNFSQIESLNDQASKIMTQIEEEVNSYNQAKSKYQQTVKEKNNYTSSLQILQQVMELEQSLSKIESNTSIESSEIEQSSKTIERIIQQLQDLGRKFPREPKLFANLRARSNILKKSLIEQLKESLRSKVVFEENRIKVADNVSNITENLEQIFNSSLVLKCFADVSEFFFQQIHHYLFEPFCTKAGSTLINVKEKEISIQTKPQKNEFSLEDFANFLNEIIKGLGFIKKQFLSCNKEIWSQLKKSVQNILVDQILASISKEVFPLLGSTLLFDLQKNSDDINKQLVPFFKQLGHDLDLVDSSFSSDNSLVNLLNDQHLFAEQFFQWKHQHHFKEINSLIKNEKLLDSFVYKQTSNLFEYNPKEDSNIVNSPFLPSFEITLSAHKSFNLINTIFQYLFSNESAGDQIINLVKNLLDYFRFVRLNQNNELRIANLAALFRNDFLFFSHQINLMSFQIFDHFPRKMLLLEISLHFKQQTNDLLLSQVSSKKTEINEEILSCNAFKNLEEKSKMQNCLKVNKKIAKIIENLKSGWNNLVDQLTINESLLTLVGYSFDRLIQEIESIEVISAEDCPRLMEICQNLLDETQMFHVVECEDQHSLTQFALKKSKLEKFIKILDYKMIKIVDCFVAGELPEYELNELIALIKSLFIPSKLREEQIERLTNQDILF